MKCNSTPSSSPYALTHSIDLYTKRGRCKAFDEDALNQQLLRDEIKEICNELYSPHTLPPTTHQETETPTARPNDLSSKFTTSTVLNIESKNK